MVQYFCFSFSMFQNGCKQTWSYLHNKLSKTYNHNNNNVHTTLDSAPWYWLCIIGLNTGKFLNLEPVLTTHKSHCVYSQHKLLLKNLKTIRCKIFRALKIQHALHMAFNLSSPRKPSPIIGYERYKKVDALSVVWIKGINGRGKKDTWPWCHRGHSSPVPSRSPGTPTSRTWTRRGTPPHPISTQSQQLSSARDPMYENHTCWVFLRVEYPVFIALQIQTAEL